MIIHNMETGKFAFQPHRSTKVGLDFYWSKVTAAQNHYVSFSSEFEDWGLRFAATVRIQLKLAPALVEKKHTYAAEAKRHGDIFKPVDPDSSDFLKCPWVKRVLPQL